MIAAVKALARTARTAWVLSRISNLKKKGRGIHIGANARIWAPDEIEIGNNVYIGKDVHIECNCVIGDFALIANRVALVGRRDHDIREIGIPTRFSTWIGDRDPHSPERKEQVFIESDVWIGFGAIVLSGVRVGRGAVIAAGAVVAKNVLPYQIVAGNPAIEIARRYEQEDVACHEMAMSSGTFEFSEKGTRHWVVRPGS